MFSPSRRKVDLELYLLFNAYAPSDYLYTPGNYSGAVSLHRVISSAGNSSGFNDEDEGDDGDDTRRRRLLDADDAADDTVLWRRRLDAAADEATRNVTVLVPSAFVLQVTVSQL